jgi:hypothetical protein
MENNADKIRSLILTLELLSRLLLLLSLIYPILRSCVPFSPHSIYPSQFGDALEHSISLPRSQNPAAESQMRSFIYLHCRPSIAWSNVSAVVISFDLAIIYEDLCIA